MTEDELLNFSAVAQYNFKGKNNDELSFRKNDVICVIQKLDGGWWEGSLNGKIGWFPSNFVRSISSEDQSQHYVSESAVEKQRVTYRNEIISNYLKNEEQHIELLNKLCLDYTRCIEENELISEDEVLVLRSNISEILDQVRQLHTQSSEEYKRPLVQQRFGKIFLDFASDFYSPLKLYCENHCVAVELINFKRSELEQILSECGLDIKFWIASLSAVYKHIEKYATTLQEIERTTAESHADRGNLQRSVTVYRDLYDYCEFVRRQKETQMEFLASGALTAFGADWTSLLGRCVHVTKVGVSAMCFAASTAFSLEEAVIRCMAIFTNSILLFESLVSKGGYALKIRLACDDLYVAKETSLCMLCFRKASKNLLVVKALTNDDFRRLCDALAKCDGVSFDREPLELDSPQNDTASMKENIYVNAPMETSPSHDSADAGLIPGGGGFLRRNRAKSGSMRSKKNKVTTMNNGLVVNHDLEMIMPEGLFGETNQSAGSPNSRIVRHRGANAAAAAVAARHGLTRARSGAQPPYSGWCLRPLPPPRGEYLQGSAGIQAVKLRKGLSAEEQEDAQMLKIVEGYFGSGSASAISGHLYRHGASGHLSSLGAGVLSPAGSNKRESGATIMGGPVRRAASYPDEVVVGVAADSRPQLIVAENEKIFVEEMEGDQVVVKERSLVDTVYALKDQVGHLQKEMAAIAKNFEKEQKARRRFEDSLRRSSAHLSHSTTPKPLDAHKLAHAE